MSDEAKAKSNMAGGNFKKGDIVIHSHRANSESVCKVERTTKTMAIIGGGGRFSISSGLTIGGGQWSGGCIKMATDSEISRVRAKNLKLKNLRAINDFNFSGLSDDKIIEIISIIN